MIKMQKPVMRILSIILIVSCVFGLFDAVKGLKDIQACKAYWEETGEEAKASFDLLEGGIAQLKENEETYLAGAESYAEGLADYEAGQDKLAAGAEELAKGEATYANGAQRLADGKRQVAENKQKIAEAKAQLEAGKAELAEGEQQLADNKQAYEEGKAKLAQATPIYMAVMPLYQNYLTAKSAYETAQAQYEQAVANGDTLGAATAMVAAQVAKNNMDQAAALVQTQLAGYTIEGIINEYQDGQAKIAEYEAGQAKVAAGRQKIAESEQKIAESEEKIAAAEKKLAESDNALAAGRAKLDNGHADYDNGLAKLAEGKEQLAEGLTQLGVYTDGEAQIADGLELALGTETYYDKAGNALVKSIAERVGEDFTYWQANADGTLVFVNDKLHLDLDKAGAVVTAGRSFLEDTTAVVTKELTGRAVAVILTAAASLLSLVAGILGLLGKRGALILAALTAITALVGLVFINGAPMSALAGSKAAESMLAPIVLAAVGGVYLLCSVIVGLVGSGSKAVSGEKA